MACIIQHRVNFVYEIQAQKIVSGMKTLEGSLPTMISLYTWHGCKIAGLMLEHFLFKKLHSRNVVTLNVLPSPIPAPLHANLPLLEAVLQVIF